MIDTNNLYIVNGKHKGCLWTRVPRRYLMWVANITNHQDYELAISELERRGSSVDDETVEITAHAIDRASLVLYRKYLKERKDNEGLYSWIYRNVVIADKRNRERRTEVDYNKITFIFKFGRVVPVLVTVYKSKY